MNNKAWIEIPDKHTRRKLYKKFGDRFNFHASTRDWPGIDEPTPSLTYQISSIWQGSVEDHDRLLEDFHVKILRAFKSCVTEGQWIYTTDVYHYDHKFYPHVPFNGKDPEGWLTPPFPNGEYSIFVTQNFSFGLFGHPWEQTICVFGEPVVKAIKQNKPEIFSHLIRKNGKNVAKSGPRSRAG